MDIEITKTEKIKVLEELETIKSVCYNTSEYNNELNKLISLISNAKKGDVKIK